MQAHVGRWKLPRAVLPVAIAGFLLASSTAVAGGPAEEATYNGEHFSITWDVEGPDAPDLTDLDQDGLPDGVRRMLDAFERARLFLLHELGYSEPPVDDLYPLYVSGGAVGGSVHELPGGVGRSKPSYVVMDPYLVAPEVQTSRMEAFAVHEYLHAIQVGYDSDEAMWIREASSAWVEDVFVDAFDPNHHYLQRYLPFPGSALTSADGSREYGAFVFLQFLLERYSSGDPSLVREIWEQMAVPEAFPGAGDLGPIEAIEAVLAARDVTLTDAWGEFLMWQRRLAHFEEGTSYRRTLKDTAWPAFAVERTVRKESCRIEAAGGRVPPLAGEFARFFPDARSKRSSAILAVKGPPLSTGYYLMKSSDGQVSEHRLVFDQTGTARAVVPFAPGAVRTISVGVGHTEDTASNIAYSLRVDGAGTTELNLSGATSTTYFTPATLSARVDCGGSPAPYADVLLKAEDLGSGEVTTTPLSTDDEGFLRTSVTPLARTTYRLELVDALLSNTVSEPHTVAVSVHTSLEVPDRPVEGLAVTVTGRVSPAHVGGRAHIQFRRPEGVWRSGPTVDLDPAGAFSVELSLPDHGVWQVRAVGIPGDQDHDEGRSAVKTVRLLS